MSASDSTKTNEPSARRQFHAWCHIHGDLGPAVDVMLSPILNKPICPACFCAWLTANFPVTVKEVA